MKTAQIRIAIPALALLLGLAEAGFIFFARQGLNGGGLRILTWLSVLIVLRFFLQDGIALLEVRAMREKVSALRDKLLSVLRLRSVPAYRTELQTALKHALNETLPRIGEGSLAQRRVQAAALQGLILIPCLFFLSWKLALMSLLLLVPAWLAARWRSRALRTLERDEVRGRMEGKRTLADFRENLESTSGGAGLKISTKTLEMELEKTQTPEWRWRTAQARYPALLEVGFFFALAGLVWVGGSSLGAWESWILFSGLLLLAYRPVREAARHYPISLQGTQARRDFEKLMKEWEALPRRKTPAAHPNKNTLALDRVGFGYEPGQKGFQNLSLEFDPHAITGITGPNGAGKTTLLRLLAGVEIPLQGNVYWTESAQTFGSIAYLPQRVSLGSNWLQWARDMKTSQPDRWKDLNALLRVDRLLAKGEPEGLSGGEKQRIALAQVLCSDAPFLLMDEPTTALPGDEREDVLKGVIKMWGRGALIVSHESFLNRICDTVVLLDSEGKHETSFQPSPGLIPLA